MNNNKSWLPGTLWSLLLVLLAGLGLAACASDIPSFQGRTVVTNHESMTMKAGGGLDFEVTEFQWVSAPRLGYVKVTGKARNNGEQGVQSVRLTAQVYDQDHNVLGAGRAFLYPAYLGPGKSGEFEFNFQFSGHKPESLRLECVFGTLK